MLFLVRMKVSQPAASEDERFEGLKREEKAVSADLQRQGKWRHLWRVAGAYENVSVFEVADAAELHAILTSLPLFRNLSIETTALVAHPSAIAPGETTSQREAV